MLELTVFLCGALVMILEMTGGRVLAPHVGTSAIVWTSLIGVVLAFLAAGAWAGGKFADKKLSGQGLAQALTGAGIGCMLPAFCHNAIGHGITSQIGNLYIAAVLAAICIFALPAFFFGMITPYVIRLRIANIDTAGSTVGRLYALSTAGSILGTFLGGFVLISWFSSTAILWATACSVLVLSILNYRQKPWLRIILLGLSIFLAWQDSHYFQWLADKSGTKIIESAYNSIRLMEGNDIQAGGKKVHLLATDPGYTQSGMIVDEPNELYFNYTRFYALGPQFAPNAAKVLMLGGGGYSVPKWLLAGKSGLDNPQDISLTVVEIDPEMTAIAKDFFDLPEDERLHIKHEDARIFLNHQTEKFDLIFVDVFNSHYSIPFQMGTLEAIQAMGKALAPGGVLLMNLISAIEGEDGRLFRAIWQNLVSVFPDVKVYCVSSPSHPEMVQNLMVVAHAPKEQTQADNHLNLYSHKMSPDINEIARMEKHLYTKPIPKDVPPLRDDYSPVERYTLMLTRQ